MADPSLLQQHGPQTTVHLSHPPPHTTSPSSITICPSSSLGSHLNALLFPSRIDCEAQNHEGLEIKEGKQETRAAVIFNASLSATFQLIHQQHQHQACLLSSHEKRADRETSRDREKSRQSKRQHSRRPLTLFLTAHPPSELHRAIRQDSHAWRTFAKHVREEGGSSETSKVAEGAQGRSGGLLNFMDEIEIRHVPTPTHLIALLALLTPTLSSLSSLPALIHARLQLVDRADAVAPTSAGGMTSANTSTGASLGTSTHQSTSKSKIAREELTTGDPRTTLRCAPSLLILHGLSQWFSFPSSPSSNANPQPQKHHQQAPNADKSTRKSPSANLENLVSAISHATYFANKVVPLLNGAQRAEDPPWDEHGEGGEGELGHNDDDDEEGASIFWFDNYMLPCQSKAKEAEEMEYEEGAEAGDAEPRVVEDEDLRAVLQAVAVRYFDTVVHCHEADSGTADNT